MAVNTTQQTKSLLEKILEWSQGLPAWQGDVLRRLFLNGELTSDDFADVVALAKLSHGILDDKGRTPVVLVAAEVPIVSPLQGQVVLNDISDTKHVNLLKEGETLRFSPTGVTVIYGDNGAGKSGYGRILKRVCRARDTTDEVLDNASLSASAKGTPEAKITATVGINPPVKHQWHEGSEAPEVLSALSLFDGRCARQYLDNDNEVAYMPYGIDLVEGLGKISKEVKDLIQKEADEITIDLAPFQDFKNTTRVGKFISTLSKDSDLVTLEELCTLSETEKQKLVDLNKVFEATNPLETAKQLREKVGRLEHLATECDTQELILTSDVVEGYKTIHNQWTTTKATAELVAKKFSEDPALLSETGNAAWRELFRAAQLFAKSAYPEHVTETLHDKDKCVLCQQPLKEGVVRMQTFDVFVQGEAEKNFKLAETSLNQLRSKVRMLTSKVSLSPALQQEINEHDLSLGEKCKLYKEGIDNRIISVQAVIASEVWQTIDSSTPCPASDLKASAKKLVDQAVVLEKSVNVEERKTQMLERDELLAREKMVSLKALAVATVELYKKRSLLNSVTAGINTSAISTKIKTFTSDSVSKSLAISLNDEFDKLGIGHIKVELTNRAEYGTVYHKLKLNLPTNIAVARVLSDGEQRALALSSFLAEISQAPIKSGIIFDDPMSSLDHKHREKFAKRIVEEASSRQVIVFTHDMVFLSRLQDQCTRQGITLFCQTVQQTTGGAGIVSEGLPFEGMTVKNRLSKLNSLAQDAKTAETSGDQVLTQALLKHGYEQLRETWERAVEELLLGDVITRFSPGVATQKLKAVIVEEADYLEVEAGMSRCSDFTHDSARAFGTVTILSSELEADIEALDKFRKRINTRNEVTIKARKVFEKPPVAVIKK